VLTSRIQSRFRHTPFFNHYTDDYLLSGFSIIATEYNIKFGFDDDLKHFLYMVSAANKRREDRKSARQLQQASL
jgi:hypothetical protein